MLHQTQLRNRICSLPIFCSHFLSLHFNVIHFFCLFCLTQTLLSSADTRWNRTKWNNKKKSTLLQMVYHGLDMLTASICRMYLSINLCANASFICILCESVYYTHTHTVLLPPRQMDLFWLNYTYKCVVISFLSVFFFSILVYVRSPRRFCLVLRKTCI